MHAVSTADHAGFQPLRAFIEQAVGQGAFPGASWGVWHRGQLRALDAAGRFTYDPSSPAVQANTRYDLASVSKVVATTAAAMLLYQRGMLALDTPLGDLLPGFVIASERGSAKHRVTLRLLLAHASGLPGYAPLFLEHTTSSGLLRACLQMPLRAAPGTEVEYSDIGFILLGKALEVLCGENLASFCCREIFPTLDMHATGYCPDPSERATFPPTEQDEVFRHCVVQGHVHDENCDVLGGVAGHAGLFAPAGDLLRFAECMLAPLRTPRAHETLFSADTVRLFTRRADLPAGSSRALGWDTPSVPSSSGEHFSPDSIGHLGYTGTSLWIDPARNLAVVLLTNRTWPTRQNKQIQQVRPAFHDLVAGLL